MNEPSTRSLIFLELNEVNFDFVRSYAREGRLPAIARLLDSHGYAVTESEKSMRSSSPGSSGSRRTRARAWPNTVYSASATSSNTISAGLGDVWNSTGCASAPSSP